MSEPPGTVGALKTIGLVVFVVFCGLPALEINGFGFGIPLTLETALICAIIGGAVGGILICPRPFMAGLLGGLLAGPVGLVALYYYTQNRQQVSKIELVLVQGLASLPGLGVGWLVRKILHRESESSDSQIPR